MKKIFLEVDGKPVEIIASATENGRVEIKIRTSLGEIWRAYLSPEAGWVQTDPLPSPIDEDTEVKGSA